MVYKKFKDLELSQLAMGCMRLPVIDGDDTKIDVAQTKEMVKYAMSHGVNYYDTAWGYHAGNSELVMGEALKDYDRSSFYLATKFPGYDVSNFGKVEEIFEEQLKKLQTDYFDFYLIHNVCEMNIEQYLDDAQYKSVSYLKDQVKNGRIKHLGFSAHGSLEVIQRFLDAYAEDMEFCQLQLNYLDWTFQDGREKVALCKKYNLPVWVMEPVRGGKLASLPEKYEQRLKALRPDEETVAWAFRFLQSQPEITTILSGMSDFEQMKANIATFEEDKPLNEAEMKTLMDIAQEMLSVDTVPCTACHYCTSHCPQGIDIPYMLSLYNEHAFTGGGFLAPMALMAVEEGKRPQDCIACRSCEAVCPQAIKISDTLADFVSKL